MSIGKFKFPIDDSKEEVDDELEYYTDDAWQDFDPSEHIADDDDVPFDWDLDEEQDDE